MTQPSMPHNPELLLSHHDFVRGLAHSLVADPGAAEDVAQETLIAALGSAPPQRSLRAWLSRVTRNGLRQRARAEGRRARREHAVARDEALPSVADVVEREAVRREVVEAVLTLDEPARTIVLLRYFEELPPRKIAQRLEMPVETVRTRLKRALAHLRTRLDAQHGGARGSWALALAPATGRAALGGASTWLQAAVGSPAAWAIVGVLAVGGALALWLPTEDTAAAPALAGGTVPAAQGQGTELVTAGSGGRVAVPVAQKQRAFTGRVLGPDDVPIPGALVVATDAQRAGILSPDARGALDGSDSEPGWLASTRTGEDGRFELAATTDERSWIGLAPWSVGPYQEPLGSTGGWFRPGDEVVFRVAQTPLATVVVRCVVSGSGEPIEGFRCSFWRASDRRHLGETTATTWTLEQRLPVPSASPSVEYVLLASNGGDRARHALELRAGERVEIELALGGPLEVRGHVVDTDGVPIADALVFMGTQIRMRGDEPFKPFAPDRIHDGVRTDADGMFTLTGVGDRLTVWHAEHSPVTVAVVEAGAIVLPPRTSIDGRLVDRAGAPLAGVEVALDRGARTTTDPDGRFVFAAIEAGVRGLVLPGRWIIATATADEPAELEIGPGIESVQLEILRAGVRVEESCARFEGILVGLDPLGGAHPVEVESGQATIEGVLPGRYLLLSKPGYTGIVPIDAEHASLDLGTYDLTVHATPGETIYVVPEPANELVHLLGGRIAGRRVPLSGEAVFAPLPAGRYVIGVEKEGGRLSVDVDRGGVIVELD